MESHTTKQVSWIIYMIRCNDGTLYTGITKDVERRVHEHNYTDKGAKYTRTRRPCTLTYEEFAGSHGEALRRERAIKKLKKKDKEKLCEFFLSTLKDTTP